MFGSDLLGFGNRRKWALEVLDRALTDLEVNPVYIDDGMRFAIYKWALEEEGRAGPGDAGPSGRDRLDTIMRDAAALISFCVLGARETEEQWGATVRAAREARFDAVLAKGEDETFDARLIKLVLAKNVAAPDIRAKATLE